MVNLILDAGGLNITSIKALVSTCLIEVEFDMEEWNSSSYSSLRFPWTQDPKDLFNLGLYKRMGSRLS